jgi:cyclopropane-fatty-acyl-phospholipid synthase
VKRAVRTNFDGSVGAYDAYENRTGRFETLSRLLVAELTARGGDLDGVVLDAGAGTGASTAPLAAAGATPIALDVSRGMLRENESSARLQGDIDTLPLRTDSVDAVAFTASLFLVPDPSVAAGEAARVLRPGGVVGAVAPVGWFDDDGDVFDSLPRESRSPTGYREVTAALADAFEIESGFWRFTTTAEDVRSFHAIPAVAARLYPDRPPAERTRAARSLLEALSGTVEERWQFTVGRLPDEPV